MKAIKLSTVISHSVYWSFAVAHSEERTIDPLANQAIVNWFIFIAWWFDDTAETQDGLLNSLKAVHIDVLIQSIDFNEIIFNNRIIKQTNPIKVDYYILLIILWVALKKTYQ